LLVVGLRKCHETTKSKENILVCSFETTYYMLGSKSLAIFTLETFVFLLHELIAFVTSIHLVVA
jgi:hypothetical protein